MEDYIMATALLIGYISMTITSFIFALLAFIGKDIILDDTYIKASNEERKKMDKSAYRLQSGIIFFFLFLISLCNTMRAILHLVVFTYIACVCGAIGIIYTIVSHYRLKKKYLRKTAE